MDRNREKRYMAYIGTLLGLLIANLLVRL